MADLKALLGEAYKEGMTAEEITKAFESIDPYTGYVKKDIFDRTASEVADWKKKHNQLLTEEERKEAERLESQKNIEAELKTLRRDKTVSESKAKFIGLGYDVKLAEETASALADGNMDLVFTNQQKHLENHDKALKAQMLNNTPTPGAGNPGNVNYTKKIEEATANGNMLEVAYYTRLQNGTTSTI